MTTAALIAYALACAAIVIVPGPTVTVIVANSLRAGPRAGLLNVAGTQFGLVWMMLIVALGLETVVALMAEWFWLVKLAGAAYLIWLGIRLWRSDGRIGTDAPPPRIGYFWQGVLVIWSNPKALVLFGAFIPQFIEPPSAGAAGSAFWQTMALGGIFMMIATVLDSLYALAAGKAGAALTRSRVQLVEKASGTLLIGGGLWMASLQRES